MMDGEASSSGTWRFAQAFGDKGEVEDITEGASQAPDPFPNAASSTEPTLSHLSSTVADIISTVEFDHTGDYLATGDKGGRVVLFERNETVRSPSSPSLQWLTHLPIPIRKNHANTSSTQNSNRMNPNLTI
jgi:hypothetical protein